MIKKVLLSITLVILTAGIGSIGFALSKNKPPIFKKAGDLGQAVLAASTEAPHFIFKVNVPSFFNDTAQFTKDVNIDGGLSVQGKAIFNSSISLNNNNLDLGTGTLTASNVLYGLKAGNGITIGSGQTPTIAVTSTGVTSLQSQTGALTLTAGSGISIDGLKISANNTTQNIFKTISDGSNSFSAGSDSDILTLAAGSGVTITTDTSSKKLTFTATGGTGTVTGSGFTSDGIMYATGDSAITSLTPGTSGYILQSNGTGVAPSWIANSGSSPSFANISTGTNTSATMTVGSGATITYTGSGVINATQLLGSTWVSPGTIGSTTSNTGAFTTLSASGTLAANGGITLPSGQNLTLSGFTSGSIPYINSSHQLAQDNTNFFWDATNKRLGLGTSSPNNKLTVVGDFDIEDTTSPTKGYRFRTSGGALDLEGSGSQMVLSNWSGASFTGTQHYKLLLENSTDISQAIRTWQFRTDPNGTTRHVIDGSTGASVVFNQDQESTDLQIEGSSNQYLFFAKGSNNRIGIGTNTPAATLDLQAMSGTLPVASISGKTSFAALTVDNSGTGDLFTASSSGLARFTITQAGNIGIGTTTPSSLMQLSQNNGSDLLLNVKQLASGPGANLQLQSTSSNARTIYNNTTANINWYTGLNADGTNNYTVYDGSHYAVTIQQNSPTNALFMSSAGAVSINNNLGGNGSLIVNQPNSAGDIFSASQSGNTKFVINNSGYIGIGTNNPTSPLYVNGSANDMVVMNSSLDTGFIRPFEMLDSSMTSGHNLVYHVGHDLGTNDTAYFGFNYQGANSTNNFITLGMWGADNLVNINANGNLGIGTTTPKNKLDVVGSAAIGSYAGTNTAPSNSLIVSGNVGIGNNNPSNLLDVNGSANDMVVLTSTLSTGFIRPFEMLDSSMTAGQNLVYHVGHDTSTNNTAYIGFHYTGSGNPENWLTMGFWGNDTIYNFTPSGHVGFGTTSMGNGALVVNQINNAGDLFSASASGTTKFVINNSGNVGIGTNTPQRALHVLGTSVFDNSNNPSDWTDPVSLIRSNINQNNWLWFHTGSPTSIGSSTFRWGLGMTGGSDDLILRSANVWNSAIGGNDTVLRTNNSTGNIALGFGESIGTTNPLASSALDIEWNSLGNSALVVNNSGGAGDIFTASSAGTTVFNVNKNGNTRITGSLCVKATFTTACAGSTAGTIYATNTTVQSADVAENYISSQTLEPGDVIMPAADGNNQAVIKTTSAYQVQTIGIVSTKPGVTLNSDAQTDSAHPNLYPIALQGRIPVKVSTINGQIHTGDLLTTSNIPGVAMKATAEGQIIGKALEDYLSNDNTAIGKIMVFVNISWANPNMQIAITNNGDISLNGQPVNQTTTIAGNNLNQQPSTSDTIAQLQEQVASLSARIGQTNDLSQQLAEIEKTINLNQTLQSSSSAGLGLSREDITLEGSLTVAGRTTLTDLGITGRITNGLLAINGLDDSNGTPSATINTLAAPLKIQSLAINGVDFENGKLTIDTNGNLTVNANITANNITTDKLNITTDKTATDSGILSSSTGTVSIEAGTDNIDVQTTALTSKSLIFLTPNLPVAVGYKLKNNNTFNIYLQDALKQNLKINWWIIN